MFSYEVLFEKIQEPVPHRNVRLIVFEVDEDGSRQINDIIECPTISPPLNYIIKKCFYSEDVTFLNDFDFGEQRLSRGS